MSRPWTLEGLAALYALSAGRAELGVIADALGRLKGDCDHALWVMLGRSPSEALAALSGEVAEVAAPAIIQPASAQIIKFIRENHL